VSGAEFKNVLFTYPAWSASKTGGGFGSREKRYRREGKKIPSQREFDKYWIFQKAMRNNVKETSEKGVKGGSRDTSSEMGGCLYEEAFRVTTRKGS